MATRKITTDGEKMVSAYSFDEEEIKKEQKHVMEGENTHFNLDKKYSRFSCSVPQDLAMKWKFQGFDIAREPAKKIKERLIAEGRIDYINKKKSFIFT